MNLQSTACYPAQDRSQDNTWLFSLPLSMAMFAYFYCFYRGNIVLLDGDTYWHIATGQWILRNQSVPSQDPFSHTMLGAAWTAHEWLSEVILAATHQAGGWTAVVAMTAVAFAVTVGLLTRFLLRSLEPIYAFLFAALAIGMTSGHLLARPHILAMPLMMLWAIELVRASDEGRAPSLWLLPVMPVWANLHGGFTLGIALAFAFALEALLAAAREKRAAAAARSWGLFLVLTVACALLTPHGMQGILFTWQMLFEISFAHERIGEWQSPNFHSPQPLELWLLAGLALVMHQGLRLPPVRLLLLLGLLHLALKHMRNIELLGLLAPLFVAAPLAAQWRAAQATKQHLQSADRFFRKLAEPAGNGAVMVGLAMAIAVPLWISRAQPLQPPDPIAPVAAVRAARDAGVQGPVLNSYGWGGYLIFVGIAPFIDGRADMYGEDFLKEHLEALDLKAPDGLQKLLAKHKIAWTLLPAGTAPVALLDHLPGWRRLYADKVAVVHVKAGGAADRPAGPHQIVLP